MKSLSHGGQIPAGSGANPQLCRDRAGGIVLIDTGRGRRVQSRAVKAIDHSRILTVLRGNCSDSRATISLFTLIL